MGTKARRKARRKVRTAPNSAVIWSGPSMFDGSPIVAIATIKVANAGTGPVPAVTFLPDPRVIRGSFQAMRLSGADASVCWDCPQRPVFGGGCYVTPLGTASLWRAVRSGAIVNADERFTKRLARAIARARAFRLGAYGDPAAVPAGVVQGLASMAHDNGARVLGYTHQWRRPDAAHLSAVAMASVDSPQEGERAGRRLAYLPGADR